MPNNGRRGAEPMTDSFNRLATRGWHGGHMASQSRHIAESISRPASAVYTYAADPANLPAWAPGLCSSVQSVGGQWFAESPMGRIGLTFAPPNEYGVLDHHVALPGGGVVYNPMRVLADGDGSEVVFTLRRAPGLTDAEFDRDAAAVAADLTSLKDVLEQRA
jgi:hypothetical protein